MLFLVTCSQRPDRAVRRDPALGYTWQGKPSKNSSERLLSAPHVAVEERKIMLQLRRGFDAVTDCTVAMVDDEDNAFYVGSDQQDSGETMGAAAV
jgi:hypothetical protein